LLLSALAAPVFADELPKHSCNKPTIPNAQASEVVIKYFNKHMAEYKTCIDKFVTEQRAIVTANQNTDAAKASRSHDAAEAAIKEYNAYIEEINANKPKEE
jgi:hypothetical protein